MSLFPTRIVLATDGSEEARLAARAAGDMASKTGSELHVVHVVPVGAWPLNDARVHPRGVAARPRPSRGIDPQARKLLDEQVRVIEDMGGDVAEAHLEMGVPADGVVNLSEELEAGLIVIGSRGLGAVERVVTGSVSEGVVHHAPCPVLVMRGGEQAWPPTRIVIGDDSSKSAGKAAEVAASIGKLVGARALLVQTYRGHEEYAYRFATSSGSMPVGGLGTMGAPVPLERPEPVEAREIQTDEQRRAEEALAARARDLTEMLGHRPQTIAAAGNAASAILVEAGEGEEPALIAVGSRGLGPIRRAMLGSVSSKVLRAASGPVLISPQ